MMGATSIYWGMMWLLLALSTSLPASASNQTETLSPIYSAAELPFRVTISKVFELPFGIQDFAHGSYAGKWFFICGRTAGLHGFTDGPANFALRDQNSFAIVVDPRSQQVWVRSLLEPHSGLSQQEVEALIVVSPQSLQIADKLYVCGGYGPGLTGKNFYTRDTLTVIDLPQWMQWVMRTAGCPHSLSCYTAQVHSEFLRVTGGKLLRSDEHSPFLLALGQDFAGVYDIGSNGIYTKQIRPFWLPSSRQQPTTLERPAEAPQESYRRRDLNVVPLLQGRRIHFLALSGVFTTSVGAWTIPIEIDPHGCTMEPPKATPGVFKQGLNNYECANVTLYSARNNTNYVLLFGGMSLLVAKNGSFEIDELIPFTNTVSALAIECGGAIKQHYLGELFPLIYSDAVTPPQPLRFGSSAAFIPTPHLPNYYGQVLDLDGLCRDSVTIGFIVGGIASAVPNFGTGNKSTASKYIFEVKLHRH